MRSLNGHTEHSLACWGLDGKILLSATTLFNEILVFFDAERAFF